VIPFSSNQPATGLAISSASGQPIKCWGWQDTAVCFGGEQFRWHFLLAAVAFPLLGADFLVIFKLVVDLASFNVRTPAGKLLQLQSPPVGRAFALLGVQAAVAPGSWKQEYDAVMWQFPAVLNQGKSLPPVKHKVLHHIETEGRPVAAKYRGLDPAKFAAAKKEFFEMEKQGIMGLFIFASSCVQKLELNSSIFLELPKKTHVFWL
jgi:hypothetical protein